MSKQSLITLARELLWKGQSEEASILALSYHDSLSLFYKRSLRFSQKLPPVIWMSRVRCKCRIEKWGDYLFKPNHLIVCCFKFARYQVIMLLWEKLLTLKTNKSMLAVGHWVMTARNYANFLDTKRWNWSFSSRCIKVKLPFLPGLLFSYKTSQVHDVAISKR